MKKYIFAFIILLYWFCYSQDFTVSTDEKVKINILKNALDKQYSNDQIQTNLLIKKLENAKTNITDEKKLYIISQILDELYIIKNKNSLEFQNKLEQEKPKYDFYSDDSIFKFVWNWFSIKNWYVPSDLQEIQTNNYVTINAKNLKLRKETFEGLNNLSIEFNKKFSKKLTINSAYRSYEEQLALTQNATYKKVATKVNQSEHQLWLAIDISTNSNQKVIDRLSGNAYKYGFTQSYQTWDSETWLPAEPWHYRYVWIELATYLYQNNLSFKEYFFKNKESWNYQ